MADQPELPSRPRGGLRRLLPWGGTDTARPAAALPSVRDSAHAVQGLAAHQLVPAKAKSGAHDPAAA
ncbi:hypothetical protein OR60_21675, partial [Xanthomonas vesicatoria]